MGQDGKVKYSRKMQYLKMYVKHDYTKRKRIEPEDRLTWEKAKEICSKMNAQELSKETGEHDFLPKLAEGSFIQFF
jgi:hypothetical protein